MDFLNKLLSIPAENRQRAMQLADLVGPQVSLGGVPMDEGKAIDSFSGVAGPVAAIVTRAHRLGSIDDNVLRRMVGRNARPRTEEELIQWEREMFQKMLERENPMKYARPGPSMQ